MEQFIPLTEDELINEISRAREISTFFKYQKYDHVARKLHELKNWHRKHHLKSQPEQRNKLIEKLGEPTYEGTICPDSQPKTTWGFYHKGSPFFIHFENDSIDIQITEGCKDSIMEILDILINNL